MNDLAVEDPCVVFALGREAKPFLRLFKPHQRFPGAPCRARFCGEPWLTVLVAETGVGAANGRECLEWLLRPARLGNLPYWPKLVLSAGFCGALQADYRVGDVLLADEVVDLEGRRWPMTWPGELPGGGWEPSLRRGRLLTVPGAVGDPAEKDRLGRATGASAVDMETAALAEVCRRRDVPFGCARVISDDLQTALSPRLLALLSRGHVSPWHGLAALVRSPWLAGQMLRLARQTRWAAKRLATALGELLTLTLPWAADSEGKE